MSRALVSLVVVCAFAAVASATITHTVTPVGTYTMGIGSAPVVDVYDVSFDAGEGRTLGALVITVGSDSGEGTDPVQSAWLSGGKTPVLHLTPSEDDSGYWLVPPDVTKCYETDTRFLPAGIGTWAPVVVVPTEINDGSIYSAGTEDYKAGLGDITVSVAVPVSEREEEITVIRVGVPLGAHVWCLSKSADDLGVVTTDLFEIPEPATLTVLGLGALALVRRRR